MAEEEESTSAMTDEDVDFSLRLESTVSELDMDELALAMAGGAMMETANSQGWA